MKGSLRVLVNARPLNNSAQYTLFFSAHNAAEAQSQQLLELESASITLRFMIFFSRGHLDSGSGLLLSGHWSRWSYGPLAGSRLQRRDASSLGNGSSRITVLASCSWIPSSRRHCAAFFLDVFDEDDIPISVSMHKAELSTYLMNLLPIL